MTKNRQGQRTIGLKLTLLLVLFALALCVGISVFSALSSWNSYTDFYWQKSLETAELAASFVDGDRIASYLETGERDEAYHELLDILTDIKRASGMRYLYIFVPGEHSFTYVMEAALKGEDLSLIGQMGDVYEYTELEYENLVPDVQAGRSSIKKHLTDGNIYGAGVSAWAPVFDSNGNVTAMVEADTALTVVVDALTEWLLSMVLVSVGIVFAGVLCMGLAARRMVSEPLKKLTRRAQEFAAGDSLALYKSDIRTGDEMQALSEAFAQMAGDLDRYTKRLTAVAAEKERQATELSLATDIQASMLPKAIAGREEFAVFAMTQSAKEIGGDFYDFFLCDDDHLCVVTADVSSRGIPAALFMVIAKTTIKNQLLAGGPVAQSASVLNKRLYGGGSAGLTVSAFIGVLELSTGLLSYVNAGQKTPPMVMRKGGSCEPLKGQAMSPLAEMENVTYRAMELRLRQGDRLLLYTDGVPGAKNPDGVILGEERFKGVLNTARMRSLAAEEAVRAICAEIAIYEDGAEHSDDITVLALDYRKGDKARAEISVKARAEAYPQAQRFLKAQLEANGISGAFYAALSVALEEAFVLCASRVSGRDELIVRCAVASGRRDVELTLLYGGLAESPLQPRTTADGDAIDYIKRSLDSVEYRFADGKNNLILRKTPLA